MLNSTADRHLVHEVTSPVCTLMLRHHKSYPNTSDSKLLRGSEMLVEEFEDRTVPLPPLIMYSFSVSSVPTILAELTHW